MMPDALMQTLDQRLSGLEPGCSVHLEEDELERLFGQNGDAWERLVDFAASHDCLASRLGSGAIVAKRSR